LCSPGYAGATSLLALWAKAKEGSVSSFPNVLTLVSGLNASFFLLLASSMQRWLAGHVGPSLWRENEERGCVEMLLVPNR
jgi:hypothetical protein